MSQGVRRAAAVVAGFAVLLGLVVVVGWLLTHSLRSSVGEVDDDVARSLADHRTGGLTDVADVGTVIGQTLTGIIVLTLVGAVFSVWRRSWRPGLFVAAMYGGMGLFYFVGTHADPRRRPPVPILDAGLVPDHSYPSGHTGTAAAIVVCLALLLVAYGVTRSAWLVALALVPLFTGVSRLYLGAHHLSDVVVPLLLAPAWALVVARQLFPRR
jgi:membrane-associated phospholipid phosphatase